MIEYIRWVKWGDAYHTELSKWHIPRVVTLDNWETFCQVKLDSNDNTKVTVRKPLFDICKVCLLRSKSRERRRSN